MFVVQGMLETCTYEETMIDLVKKITQADVHDKMTTKLKQVKKGVPVKASSCLACRSRLVGSAEESEIAVFRLVFLSI